MATVTKWNPFGVALDITATGGTVTRKSATQYTVKINASWEAYYDGAQTNYGMTASSGGGSVNLNTFGTKSSSGSGSFTGTYSISGNGSATKAITVTFNNYEEDWQGNVTESATKTVSFNVTVPAWTSYTVKYNANGGSGAPSSQTKWKDQTLKLSTTKPTRTGYTFQGWGTSTSDTSVDYASGANYTANANITLYAIWKEITYTVKYNANGGSGAPSTQNKIHGSTLLLSTSIPTRTSIEDNGTLTTYTFKGWGTSPTSTAVAYKAGASYTTNASIILYAVWSKTVSTNLYDVSYNTNGGSEVISQIKTKGKTLKLRDTIPVKNGYTFSGWGLTDNSTTAFYQSGDNYTTDKDIVLYAVWTPWTHTVTFDACEGLGDAPSDFVKTTGIDVIIPESSITKNGHVFKYWSTQPSGSGGDIYHAGDGYVGVKNGGVVTLYAIWDTKNITLYKNGNLKAGEFIEEDYCSFNNDGTVHYVQFIEGNSAICFKSDGLYVAELMERSVSRLTDESDNYLIDEFGNYLTTII